MNKSKVLKIIILVVAIAVFVGAIVYLMPVMKDILTKEGQIAFRDKISASGIWGVLTLIALQLAQIALIVLPGEPIEILAGMCYGSIWGTVFIMITSTFMTIVLVWLVSKFGKKIVYETFNKEKVDKIINSRIYQNPKKIEFIMLILFLIPGTPKDLLVYVAGLLPINLKRFVIISTIARLPSVISSTISGDIVATGDWRMSIIIYSITYLIVGIMIFILNIKDKGKTMKVAMRRLK